MRNHELTETNMHEVKGFLCNVDTDMQKTIQDVSIYLQEHYTENLTLDNMAKQFHISKSSLTTNFKKMTGLTIKEYVRLYRIRKARQLLLKTNLSITEIALQTGFGNVTYFERVFKTFYEMSPLRFRKQTYFLE